MKPSVLSTLAACASTTSALLAFPGAERFGRNAVGGRGGTVYKVTNLKYEMVQSSLWGNLEPRLICYPSDSGAGSLLDAVSEPNRIVVFATGGGEGVINISSRIVVSKSVYIAGQTAPGEVCTHNGPLLEGQMRGLALLC